MTKFLILAVAAVYQGLEVYTLTLDQVCCEGAEKVCNEEGMVTPPVTCKVKKRLTVSIVTVMVDHVLKGRPDEVVFDAKPL